MGELTIQQKKAIAIATARKRARDAAAQQAEPQPQQQSPSWADTGMDMLKSAGTGLAKGVMGLGGAVGDVQQMTGDIVGWSANRLGASPETQEMASGIASRMAVPGFAMSAPRSGQIRQTVEGFTGPMYQPQTTAGEYAQTIGEFAPGAAMGPGGLARKAALTVIPAIASETGGQITKGTAAEPYARFGGALLGGAVASQRGNAGTKQLLGEAPSSEQVKGMADDAYQAIRDAKVVFDQKAYKSTAMKIQSDLRKEGLLPEQGGEVSSALNNIMTRVKKVNGWTEVDSLRQNIGKLAASRDPAMAMDARRARIIRKHLDDLVDKGATQSLRGVPRDQIGPMVGKARELGRRNIIGRDIERMKDKGEWYVSGDESGLRNQFASYGKKNETRLTPMEESAFKAVVRREGVLNPLTSAGSRLGQIAVGSTGFGLGGLPGALVSIVGSAAARKFMEVYTMKGVDAALKTVLAGKTAQQKAAVLNAISGQQGKAQTLLAAESGRRQDQEPMMYDAKGNAYAYPLLGQ